MGAEFPLLLQPSCPANEDPGIADFLRLAAELCSASWAELALQPLRSDSQRIYARGVSKGGTKEVSLDAGDGFVATLRIEGAKQPGGRVLEVLSASLKTVLDRESLRIQSSILSAALDSNWSSVLLFDTACNILYANPPADRLLSLQTEDHVLAETDGESPRPIFSLLCTLIEKVSPSGALNSWQGTIRIADGRTLSGKVNCLYGQEHEAQAYLVLLQPATPEPRTGIGDFLGRYNLSRRESEVVRLLLEGMTTVAMAERLGISQHTIRDHLKHLYKKTSTNSRSELLGLISRSSRTIAAYDSS